MVRKIEMIVVGGSAGALEALATILPALPHDYTVPIAVVVHVPPEGPNQLVGYLASRCVLAVKEAEDKEALAAATIYVAPANYHLLVEKSGCFSLSVDDPVNFSRPAIDVLFESAAEAFGAALVGVLLTGANGDGALGLAKIHDRGGTTVLQSPDSASMRAMPDAALRLFRPDRVLPPDEIGPYLVRVGALGPTIAETR